MQTNFLIERIGCSARRTMLAMEIHSRGERHERRTVEGIQDDRIDIDFGGKHERGCWIFRLI